MGPNENKNKKNGLALAGWVAVALVTFPSADAALWTDVDDADVPRGWLQPIAEAAITNAAGGYAFSPPAGWRTLTNGTDSLASRGAPREQRIEIMFRPHGSAFRADASTSSTSMSPQDQAENLLAEIRAAHLADLEIYSRSATEVDGHSAFRLELGFRPRDASGPEGSADRMRQIVYGAVDTKGLYLLVYTARAADLYDRDRESFEALVRSFSFASSAARRTQRAS